MSRNPSTQKYRCHIFRCSVPARALARVLLESHQHQRRFRQRVRTNDRKSKDLSSPEGSGDPPDTGVGVAPSPGVVLPQGPGGHEHYERITCVYIGSCDIGKDQTMKAVNEAVERLSVDQHQWQDVAVDVAISSIKIADLKVRHDRAIMLVVY